MVTDVFRENGFQAAWSGPANLVFEKKGSALRNLAYGNWIGDEPVWVRVKVAIVPAAEGVVRVQCHAYMLRDRAGTTEEEMPISSVHSGPYRKLLKQVAKRLAQPQ